MMRDISLLTNKALFGMSAAASQKRTAQKPQTKSGKPPTKCEVYDFAQETGNVAFAVDFLDMNARTNWHDGKGRKIMNWKGAFLNFCRGERAKEGISRNAR